MAVFPDDVYQPETANHGAPRAILILTADGTEDLEFFYPYYRFIEAGFKTDVVTPKVASSRASMSSALRKRQGSTTSMPRITPFCTFRAAKRRRN